MHLASCTLWLWQFSWYRNNRQQCFVSSGKRRYTNADYYNYYSNFAILKTWNCFQLYSGIFYFCQFIKSFRSLHSFWEEDDLSREINTSFTEWHHYHIMVIQFQNHSANGAVAHFKNLHVCFHLFLFTTNFYKVFDY